ncbi:MlaD family protein [Chelativorans salis]|uniref:MCE family protein n=1 Tax=Chelativorans salis TaxID=2978478 RepID=A0ABT2LLT3_9HYPH|nr:MlaD family protein [Chelativorans sp. EGI FJ00035]MCT7375488.1 MCE family protein [Chelativorans sp. EGI FJ00035]
METKANYVIVGIFTVLAVLAAFGFIYWTAGIGGRGEMTPMRFRIPGSALGLGPDSAVLFNGVRVGNVRRVYVDPENPRFAIADAEVNREQTPITASTRAEVGLATLTTGQAAIELTGGDPDEPNLLDQARERGEIATISASPSAVTNLLQTTQSVLTRADSMIGELEDFVSDARGPLTETLNNVETFTKALADNADGVDQFLASVGELSQTISDISGQLNSTLRATEELINSVDKQQVADVVDNVDRFTQQLADAGERLDGIATGVDEAVASLGTFSENANRTLSKVDEIVAGVDADAVASAVDNFAQASAELDRASNDIARVSETIGQRNEDIDQFITDASSLASRLNQASVRIDGVLAKLDGMLEEGDGEGLMAEARATLQSFREVADTLNARVGTITEGLARFSGQGLRDVEALVNDARRSINRIEQAVSDFEQNPQRIITGGEGSIRRYDGRSRR